MYLLQFPILRRVQYKNVGGHFFGQEYVQSVSRLRFSPFTGRFFLRAHKSKGVNRRQKKKKGREKQKKEKKGKERKKRKKIKRRRKERQTGKTKKTEKRKEKRREKREERRKQMRTKTASEKGSFFCCFCFAPAYD